VLFARIRLYIHVTHILAKSETANRTEAAAFAHRHRLA
jgi:DNA-binding NarL/FixJ family response regulator